MKQYIFPIAAIFFSLVNAYAQSPANRAVIKHTQVMYEFNAVPSAMQYRIRVFKMPAQKKVLEEIVSHPVHLAKNLLEFGGKYEWEVVGLTQSGEAVGKAQKYSFSIQNVPEASPNKFEAIVQVNQEDKFVDGLIIPDNGYIVNRKGGVVYYIDSTITYPRATQLTPQSTLIYLDSVVVVERSLQGKILWKSPNINNDSLKIIFYHHDAVKTLKGTYLCIAKVQYKHINQQVSYSSLFEFDRNNNIVWYWSERYFYPNDSNRFKASHLNSMFYDEKEEKIYLSNRDLHSLTKIDKLTGEIEYSYGYNVNDEVIYFINPIFKMQHRIRKLQNGNFLVFNNDSGESADFAHTKVLEITDPEIGGGESEVVWEYPFQFENQIENFVPRMGGAFEMPNNNVLVAGGVFDKVFEVNRDGEMVWLARFVRYAPDGHQTAPACYRASYASSLFPYHFILYQSGEDAFGPILVNSGSEKDIFIVSTQSGEVLTEIALEPSGFISLSEYTQQSGSSINVQSQQSGVIKVIKL
jgi:hypothetical protein